MNIIFDTETTGLTSTDEIVELAITNENGDTIYCQRFKPTCGIHPSASEVTGITDDMLDNEPTFVDEYDKIVSIFSDCNTAIAYNVQFDLRMLRQTCKRYNLDARFLDAVDFECAMLKYTNFANIKKFGGPNFDSYAAVKNQKLTNACQQMSVKVENAHAATGDCVMTAKLLQAMRDDVNGHSQAS